MKKYLFLFFFFVLGFAASVNAQQAAPQNGPVLAFEKSTHDFGDINQGDKVEFTYKFTNTGNEPLLITNVEVQCGCTTPKGWPRDPVPPGQKGELTISFNSAGKQGLQNKAITIISNAVNAEGKKVTFTTNVLVKNPQ